MINVGFIIEDFNPAWIGGINYFRNLINAVSEQSFGNIGPVIITGSRELDRFAELFPGVQIRHSSLLQKKNLVCIARKALKKISGDDILLKKLIADEHISVLSHSGCFVKSSPVATIGWIPDFQHKYLPEFFETDDLAIREREFEKTVRYCNCVIFSSNNAKSDAETFYPEFKDKYVVLHFVSNINAEPDVEKSHLMAKYSIPDKYFLLPNQFWIHKNHPVVLDAIKFAKSRNPEILVVATGSTEDYRQPDYFKSIKGQIDDLGIENNFRILGMVPYPDLKGLMKGAVGLINPSMFEGWSTSVEEAKSLGQKIILSNIPVHIEQDPDYAIFFNPKDPEQLASILTEEWTHYDESEKNERIFQAQISFSERRKNFASAYEKIVMNTMETLLKKP